MERERDLDKLQRVYDLEWENEELDDNLYDYVMNCKSLKAKDKLFVFDLVDYQLLGQMRLKLETLQ